MRAPLAPLLWSMAGFAAGYAAFHSASSNAPSAARLTQTAASTGFVDARTSTKERTAQLFAIAGQPNGLARDSALFEAIEAMQPDDFIAALSDLPAMEDALSELDRQVLEDLLEAAVEHWLDMDEAGALRALDQVLSATASRLPNGNLLASMFGVLARRTPQWMFSHLPLLTENPQREPALKALFNEGARKNPGQARQWLETLRSGPDWNPALAAYVEGLAYSDPRGAMDLAKAESSSGSSAYLIGIARTPSLATELLQKFEPTARAMMTWHSIQNLAEGGMSDVLGWLQEQAAANAEVTELWYNAPPAAVNVLMEQNPAKALEWVMTLSVSQDDRFPGVLLKSWSQIDSLAALDWLTAQGVELLPCVIDAAGDCALADPPRFQNWMAGLPPSETKERAAFAITMKLAKSGRLIEAQQAFPRNTGSDWFLDKTRELITAMAETNAPATADWVRRLPPGPVQNKAVLGLLDRWIDKEPIEAAHWSQSLPDSHLRDLAMRQFATQLAREDPESAALWLDQIGDSGVWSRAAGEVFKTWSKNEPARARRWLTQLPGTDDNQLKLTRRLW